MGGADVSARFLEICIGRPIPSHPLVTGCDLFGIRVEEAKSYFRDSWRGGGGQSDLSLISLCLALC